MKIPPWLIAPLAGGLYRVWNATLRAEQINRDSTTGHDVLVFSMWHDELFAAPTLRGDWNITTIVSRSRDGEYMARVLRSVGIETARGSSSRGGMAALLQIARDMRERRRHACVTIDGPRGPRHEVKDGVFFLAHHARAPLVPLRVFYTRVKKFSSWDKFQLPYPFSKVSLVFGDPYCISTEDLTPESLVMERKILKEKLEGLRPSWETQ